VQKRQIVAPRGNARMSSLKNTIDRIKSLEAEKKNLLVEIEGLRKMADAKAVALESEVGALRDEVKSLKTLINGSEPPAEQVNKIKI
jgi:predicted  nucleic acid-binding Zn-ribbon protein